MPVFTRSRSQPAHKSIAPPNIGFVRAISQAAVASFGTLTAATVASFGTFPDPTVGSFGTIGSPVDSTFATDN
jgi:hypothetical protein